MQYFEIYGNRAIYKDGWWAACKLDRIPLGRVAIVDREVRPRHLRPGASDAWALYYLPDDFTQAKDLAGQHPDETSRS